MTDAFEAEVGLTGGFGFAGELASVFEALCV
jgi:hypothetical protein